MSRLVFREGNHTYRLDGQWVPSVTGVTKTLTKPDGLITAAVNIAATYALNHVDDLQVIDPDVWLAAVKGAHRTEWDQRRDDGTMLHKLAEALITGEPMPTFVNGTEVPGNVRDMATQLARFYDDFTVEPLLTETMGFHDVDRYAGTFDLVADIGGTRWMLDYKTSQSGIYPETALQLCGYANMTHFVNDNGNDQPMADLAGAGGRGPVDRCGAVWIRPDFYELIPTRNDPDTFAVFRELLHAADFTRAKKNTVGEPITKESTNG